MYVHTVYYESTYYCPTDHQIWYSTFLWLLELLFYNYIILGIIISALNCHFQWNTYIQKHYISYLKVDFIFKSRDVIT